jgi:hypothetical protein
VNLGRIKVLGIILVGCLLISNSLLSQYVHPFNHFSTHKHIFSDSKTLDRETIYGPVSDDEQTVVIGIIPRLFSLNSAMQNSLHALSLSDPFPFAQALDLVDLSLSETNNLDKFNPLPLLPEPEQPTSRYDSYLGESTQINSDNHDDFFQNFSFVSSYSLGSFFSFQGSFSSIPSPRFHESFLEHLLHPPDSRPPNSETVISSDPKIKSFNYPDFTGTKDSSMLLTYNVFEQSFENISSPVDTTKHTLSQNNSPEPTYVRSTRQRRANWNSDSTYSWEINDFDPEANASNPILSEPTNFNAPFPGNPGKFKLNVTATGGIDSLSVLAYGMTGGNALNDYTGTNGFHFMTATGWNSSGDVTEKFEITTSGIDAWLNGFDGYNLSTDLWGVYAGADNKYYLTYTFSDLNFSPVPEPSTYFMTGILFCLIGCNRSSRNAFKSFLHKTFNHWKTKPKCLDIQKRIS